MSNTNSIYDRLLSNLKPPPPSPTARAEAGSPALPRRSLQHQNNACLSTSLTTPPHLLPVPHHTALRLCHATLPSLIRLFSVFLPSYMKAGLTSLFPLCVRNVCVHECAHAPPKRTNGVKAIMRPLRPAYIRASRATRMIYWFSSVSKSLCTSFLPLPDPA